MLRTFLAKIKSIDQKSHEYLATHFRRPFQIIDWIGNSVFNVVSQPLFALIVGLLLVVLVATNVIDIIVAVSIIGAWFVALVWIARVEWIRKLHLPMRILTLLLLGCLFAWVGSEFGHWALTQYHQQMQLAHKPPTGEPPSLSPEKVEAPKLPISPEQQKQLPTRKQQVPQQEAKTIPKILASPPEIHLTRHTNKPFQLKLTNNEDFAIYDVNFSICVDNKILDPFSMKLIPVKNEDNPNIPFPMLRFVYSNGCCGIIIQDISPHSTRGFNTTIIGENMEIDSKISFLIYDWSLEPSVSVFSSTDTKNLKELLKVPLKPGEKRTLSENIKLKVPLNPYFPQEKETRVLLPPDLLIESDLSTQRDSIDIIAFDSKRKIVFYNPGDHKVFVSHLTLRSAEHGYSGTLFIEKDIEGKNSLVQDLKPPDLNLDKWGVGSLSEESWHQLLSSQHLNETRCIQWHFFVPEDSGYKTMKEFFGNRFHEVSIAGTIFCRSEEDGHQFEGDVKVFAVPFVNQDCIAADYTFMFR